MARPPPIPLRRHVLLPRRWPSRVRLARGGAGVATAPNANAVPGPGRSGSRRRRPGHRRTRHLSVTVHGTEVDATATRIRLLATGRPVTPPPDRVTVGYLLHAWLAADRPWKPSTYVGYTSNARALSRDPPRPAARCRPYLPTRSGIVSPPSRPPASPTRSWLPGPA